MSRTSWLKVTHLFPFKIPKPETSEVCTLYNCAIEVFANSFLFSPHNTAITKTSARKDAYRKRNWWLAKKYSAFTYTRTLAHLQMLQYRAVVGLCCYSGRIAKCHCFVSQTCCYWWPIVQLTWNNGGPKQFLSIHTIQIKQHGEFDNAELLAHLILHEPRPIWHSSTMEPIPAIPHHRLSPEQKGENQESGTITDGLGLNEIELFAFQQRNDVFSGREKKRQNYIQ